MEIKFGKKVFLRDIGKDEIWLRDVLCENPAMLGFGDHLRLVKKERKEPTNGRFHFLLEDLVYNIGYEVEVMLGETDALLIANALEYWDNARRGQETRSIFAVLVAESFEGKYFNLLHTLSINLPVIVMQANLLDVSGEYVISFSRLFDLYRESEDEKETSKINESVWSEKSPWTLEVAKTLYHLIDCDDKEMEFREGHIDIFIKSRRAYRLERGSEPVSNLSFNVFDDKKVDAIREIFYNNNIGPYNLNRNREFVFSIDPEMIQNRKDIFREIVKIRYGHLLSHR
jgi:hypothetical protein